MQIENTETDVLIIGTSLYAISLAISLGSAGKDVLIIEEIYEHVIRGFYKIGKTKLNKTPIGGRFFDDIMMRNLNKAGVKFMKSIIYFDNINYHKSDSIFILNIDDFTLKANEIIYAPNIIPLSNEAPLTSDTFDKFQCSACTWSDAFFYKNQKTGIYGNGSLSANHALHAHQEGNKVTIYNPSKIFIADDFLLTELAAHKIPIINNCKNFKLISEKEQGLEYVEYEVDGILTKEECKLIFEGRATSSLKKYLKRFPKVNKFRFHRMNSLLFNHEKQFELGML